MSFSNKALSVLVLGAFTAIAAAGIDRGGIARGRLVLNSAVTVNGVAYDTSQSLIIVDGVPGTVSDLRPGQVIDITDIVYPETGAPIAGQIVFRDAVQGPIRSIDAAGGVIDVLGQNVVLSKSTIVDSALGGTAGLKVGDVVEISGLRDGGGRVVASRVDAAPSAVSEATGAVDSVNGALVTINGLLVDVSTALLVGLDEIETGDWIEVQGTIAFTRNGDFLRASVVTAQTRGIEGESEQVANVQGFVTRYVSSTDFDVDGTPVTTNADTEFDDGTPADLTLGAFVEVSGELDDTGTLLIAEEVDFDDFDTDDGAAATGGRPGIVKTELKRQDSRPRRIKVNRR